VLVVTDNGQTAVLLQSRTNRERALFIAQQLQDWLRGSPDQATLKMPSPPSDAVWRQNDEGRA
jgi:hypothetical protein